MAKSYLIYKYCIVNNRNLLTRTPNVVSCYICANHHYSLIAEVLLVVCNMYFTIAVD